MKYHRIHICFFLTDKLKDVGIGEDGKRIYGTMKKRLVKADSAIAKSMLLQLDRMRCPLRVKL